MLPKFKVECSNRLKDSLTVLGAGRLFANGDLAGMLRGSGSFVSDVYHKTALEVYEEGAKAAAATVVPVEKGGDIISVKDRPFEMIVDHPFIFAICDKRTGAIIFFGTIVDPEKLVR